MKVRIPRGQFCFTKRSGKYKWCQFSGEKENNCVLLLQKGIGCLSKCPRCLKEFGDGGVFKLIKEA